LKYGIIYYTILYIQKICARRLIEFTLREKIHYWVPMLKTIGFQRTSCDYSYTIVIVRGGILLSIDERIKAVGSDVTGMRRHLHEIPEPGLMERETTSFILDRLASMNIKGEPGPGGTGVIAFVEGRPGSATLAFRADIDALSVEEQTGLEFSSRHKGYMHACGHDGHTAMLLGFAKLLMSLDKNEREHNVLLIFQPAEEGPGGAETIVDSGLLDKHNVSCIFGQHIFPDIPEGKIGCRPGAFLAQTGEFDLAIKGRSCHGAMPHNGRDALVAASNLVLALNTIVSRYIDPIEPAVVTTGRLVSGERRNVIAGEAVLEGTMRAFNDKTYNIIRGMVIKMLESVCDTYDCEGSFEIRDMYPAVNNDRRLFDILADSLDKDELLHMDPLMIAEDFSYYQKKVPGLFLLLGSGNAEKGYAYPLHNNKFDFNEDILLLGIQMFYNLYKRYK